MKLSTDETKSGFTCKLHCMHVVVDRVVCVLLEASGAGGACARRVRGTRAAWLAHGAAAGARAGRTLAARRARTPPVASATPVASRVTLPQLHRARAAPRASRATELRRTAPTHPHTPILSPTIYYFDLYFMYRARTPGGKRFIC